MLTLEQRVKTLEGQMRKAMATTSALQGQPSDATLSIPHNDSWLFADNVDSGHPLNLRYVISKNITRVVSARLSIKLSPYRTYNTDSGANTGIESNNHNHGHAHTSAAHAHDMFDIGGVPPASTNTTWFATGSNPIVLLTPNAGTTSPLTSYTTTPGATGGDATGQSVDHTHPLNLVQTLGVTEGTVATGVTVSFDGGATGLIGDPFATDQIEIDVRPFISVSQNTWHVIAMTPSALGRIEAHLKLGVYVSAGSTF